MIWRLPGDWSPASSSNPNSACHGRRYCTRAAGRRRPGRSSTVALAGARCSAISSPPNAPAPARRASRRWASAWSAPASSGTARPNRRLTTCRASCRARTIGARAIPSRGRAPISRASASRPYPMATITFSTAPRFGQHMRTTPIACSVSCARASKASCRKASRSSCST